LTDRPPAALVTEPELVEAAVVVELLQLPEDRVAGKLLIGKCRVGYSNKKAGKQADRQASSSCMAILARR